MTRKGGVTQGKPSVERSAVGVIPGDVATPVLSGAWLFVEEDRTKVCASLKALKQNICQYGQPFGQRCDCKYGPYGVGEASGCAEVTMVIAGIEQMTDLQWQRFLRGWGTKLSGNGKVIAAPKRYICLVCIPPTEYSRWTYDEHMRFHTKSGSEVSNDSAL